MKVLNTLAVFVCVEHIHIHNTVHSHGSESDSRKTHAHC